MVRVRARPACGSVVVLLTLTVLGLGAGCTSAAESTTTPVPPETYCATSHLDGGFVILNADRLALNGQRDTARELYTSVLGSASATDTAKRCAASGLAQIALTEPSESVSTNSPAARTTGPTPPVPARPRRSSSRGWGIC